MWLIFQSLKQYAPKISLVKINHNHVYKQKHEIKDFYMKYNSLLLYNINQQIYLVWFAATFKVKICTLRLNHVFKHNMLSSNKKCHNK